MGTEFRAYKGHQELKLVDLVKQEIIDGAGDLSGVDVFYNQILVGIYKRPEKTKGGIILTDNTRKEDVYQGKVCLILKMGSGAFIDNDEMVFDIKPQVGDWIVLRPGDGWQLSLNKQECRMLVDTSIKMRINQPDMVY